MSKKQKQETIKKDEFDKLKGDFDSLEAQLKRAVADYQNLEKRVSEGRLELSTWATSELIKKILPVMDHFDKVIELGRPVLSERSESKDWFRGVELAVQQLKQVLRDEGLEEIHTGSQFDPALHEALDVREVPPSQEGSGESMDGKILEVVEKGYTLHGKIVKPARVIVGRKGE